MSVLWVSRTSREVDDEIQRTRITDVISKVTQKQIDKSRSYSASFLINGTSL